MEALGVEGLGEKVMATNDRSPSLNLVGIDQPGQEDDRDVGGRWILSEPLGHRRSIHLGQLYVEENGFWMTVFYYEKGFQALSGGDNFMNFRLQHRCRELENLVFVFEHQNPHFISSLAKMGRSWGGLPTRLVAPEDRSTGPSRVAVKGLALSALC